MDSLPQLSAASPLNVAGQGNVHVVISSQVILTVHASADLSAAYHASSSLSHAHIPTEGVSCGPRPVFIQHGWHSVVASEVIGLIAEKVLQFDNGAKTWCGLASTCPRF